MRLDTWFLTPDERGNDATGLDRRRGTAWSEGNEVQPLIHGATYFAALRDCTAVLGPGDSLYFTDWRGDPDELLADDGPTVSHALCGAAARGATVNGLIWRSHWDRLAFSAEQNRRLGSEIEAAGGCCLLDMRVRPIGSHHQKCVVIRHGSDGSDGTGANDVAFVGGIDLCHSRRDDADHEGDPQSQPMAGVYGEHPPWHDAQLAIRGPAVGDVEYTFRERWTDPQPLSRAPWRRVADRVRGEAVRPRALPPQPPDPEPLGTHAVQVLRTYPKRMHGFPFAPFGERSIARAYTKVLRRARSLVYVEDQYLWSAEVVEAFAVALHAAPHLRMVVVLPLYPDQDGRISKPPNDLGRFEGIETLRVAGGDRVAVYGIENTNSVPIYVHAKVCVIDDVWASVGSDNVNRRSWTHDSELSCAVIDEQRDDRTPTDPAGLGDGARVFARDLRLTLGREHLGRKDGDDDDLVDPVSFFDAFAECAAELEQWHVDQAVGQAGPRPQGQLRRHVDVRPSRFRQAWARPLFRAVYDPDGRPWRLRRSRQY